MLSVMTTLVKLQDGQTTSTWKFGQLNNGWFAGKSLTTGRKLFFKTLPQMDKCISRYMTQYGYTKPSANLVKQLSLFA
jgi:hypothetical protein